MSPPLDTNPPAVTVAIPAYGHATVIAATLASVFAQTYADYEVVVVNDGSTDDTAAVLKPLADAGRIRYVEQPNAGVAAARNRCLALARGRFVAFLDDDDLWPPDKLAWQVAALDESPDVDLVGGEVTRDLTVAARTVESGPRYRVPADEVFWGCPFTSPGQTLIRTDALRAVGGFDGAFKGVDDFDLYVRLARRRPLLRVRRLSLHYRDHPASYSKNVRPMLAAAAACLRQRLPEVPLRDRWPATRRGYRWLYDVYGRDLTRAARRGGGAGPLLRAFWPALATDPKLLARAVADYLGGRP